MTNIASLGENHAQNARDSDATKERNASGVSNEQVAFLTRTKNRAQIAGDNVGRDGRDSTLDANVLHHKVTLHPGIPGYPKDKPACSQCRTTLKVMVKTASDGMAIGKYKYDIKLMS